MHPSTAQKQERKPFSKILRCMTKNKMEASKHVPSPILTATPKPKPLISSPSELLHIDGLSNIKREQIRLHCIHFLTCDHEVFYSTKKDTDARPFVSALRPVSPTSATPVAVEEVYIFEKSCPKCDPKAKVLEESPDSSFIRTLKRQPRWHVCFPVVENTVPDAIRRLGIFDFEIDEHQDGEYYTAISHKVADRRLVYVVEVESATKKS